MEVHFCPVRCINAAKVCDVSDVTTYFTKQKMYQILKYKQKLNHIIHRVKYIFFGLYIKYSQCFWDTENLLMWSQINVAATHPYAQHTEVIQIT